MITIVDSHHKVLLPWAEYRNSLTIAPRVITLDHHTDTSPPFKNYFKSSINNNNKGDFKVIQKELLSEIDFKKLKTVTQAIDKLKNDEHIVAAIKTDIISSAFVIAHNAMDTDLETYNEHKIICVNINQCDTVLESNILKNAILKFNKILNLKNESTLFELPFILDIDLDYFNTFKSIDPNDIHFFKTLADKAGLITLATEPEYVESCAIDSKLTSDLLLERMLKHLPGTKTTIPF